MSNRLSGPATPPRRWSFPRALPHALLALVAALQYGPSAAQDGYGATAAGSGPARQAAIAAISGGVGEESREDMRAARPAYNVHLMFSDRQGRYLADIPYSVVQNGREVHAGVSSGPLLYLKLPPGAYRIGAEIDGTWQSRPLRAEASGTSARLSFVSRGEAESPHYPPAQPARTGE